MSIASRVEYRERQRLRAGDLQAEQHYLLGLDGRHNVGPHGWGIVGGLHVSTEGGNLVVSPGLAIDGYGRELVVRKDLAQPFLENVAGQFVYLVYCERPQGGCGDTNSRWRDSAEIVLRDKLWPMPTAEMHLPAARAAGRVTGAAPWPILLAFLNVDHTPIIGDVYFTRLLAARIASPSGRAVMRIGQENLADLYHFRVSVKDDKGRLRDRLAIDREGNSSIWGNLIVQGTTYEGSFVAANEVFKIESKSADASDFLWRLMPEIVGDERAVKVTFRKKGETETINQRFKIGNEKSIQSALSFFGRRDHPLKLLRKSLRETSIEEKKEEKKEDAVNGDPTGEPDILDDRELPLERAGGFLKFDQEVEQSEPVRCGCREDAEDEARLPEGLIFRPVTVAPADPTSRDIYSIVVEEGAQTVEQLRISGGLFAEGDFSQRVTFAGSKDPGPLQAALTIKGNGSVYLPGGQSRKVNNEEKFFDMIMVHGTTIYPPVKPDPRDPLFNDLVILAFNQGVLAISQSLLKITFSRQPQIIEVGKAWEYELELTNRSTTSPLKMQANQEVLTTTSSAFKNNFLELLELRATEIVKKTIRHRPEDIPAGAVKAKINVTATMKAGNDTVAGSATSQEIPVYQPPTVDRTSIPDSVAEGIARDFQLTIVNGNSEQVTITDIEVKGLGAVSQHPTPKTPVLSPGLQTSTTDLNIPSQTKGAPDLQVEVIVTFTWREPNVQSSVALTKTIAVIEPTIG